MSHYCTRPGITTDILDEIDAYIDGILNRDFNEYKDVIEEYDITHDYTDHILLKHDPILAINSVIDNYHSNGGTILDSSNYDFEAESGILYLIQPTESNAETSNSYFTTGHGNVIVNYDYGYKEIPTDVKKYANLLSIQLTKQDQTVIDVGAKTSEKIGNYSYSIGFKNIIDRYATLQKIETQLIRKYKKLI